MFHSFQFPLKTLAHSDKITWLHKPIIAQFCSRRFKRLRVVFLIYTAPSGIPLCCCLAARGQAPAAIWSAEGEQRCREPERGTVLWITSARTCHVLRQHRRKWEDAGRRSWQACGVISGAQEVQEDFSASKCHSHSCSWHCMVTGFKLFDFHLFLFLSWFSSAMSALT